MPKNDQAARVGGLQLDPAVLDQLNRSAATNRAALTDQQRREQKRISLRIDCPAWLKAEAERIAEQEQVNVSQTVSFILAWAFSLYRLGQPDLRAAMDENKFDFRSLKAMYGLDPDCFQPSDQDGNSICIELFTSAPMST